MSLPRTSDLSRLRRGRLASAPSPPSPLERLAAPLRGLSAGTFATLSRVRRHRVFHPYGEAFTANVVFSQKADRWLPEALAHPRRHEAIVRFSRGLGLPDALPDVQGMAVKLPDLYGAGWDQDWLMVTSGEDAVGRHLLIPTRNLLGRSYSTVLPYRRGGRLVTFGARAEAGGSARSLRSLVDLVAAGPVSFRFTIAPEGGAHDRIGTIELISVHQGPGRPLRFNPWNTSSELKPAGALNELRRDTYKASQRARPDT